MKINGKIYITFKELAEAFGLPDDVEIQLISAELADTIRERFTVWFYDPQASQLPEGSEPSVFCEFMQYKKETREARRRAIWSAFQFGGGGYRSEK